MNTYDVELARLRFAIKNLKDKVDAIQQGGTGSDGSISIYNEILSGSVDGINKTYTFAHTPVPSKITLKINGVPQPGNQYTLNGNNVILLNFTPEGTDIISSDYEYIP